VTLPDERLRAVLYTRRFLLELCSPKERPRVRREIRRIAAALLRHYPSILDFVVAKDDYKRVFGEPTLPPESDDQTRRAALLDSLHL
jgi:hypothetical protein